MSNVKINSLSAPVSAITPLSQEVSSDEEHSPRLSDSQVLTARERNNLSRQRCYQRERVEAQWKDFEYFSYEWCRNNFDNSKVFLWDSTVGLKHINIANLHT